MQRFRARTGVFLTLMALACSSAACLPEQLPQELGGSTDLANLAAGLKDEEILQALRNPVDLADLTQLDEQTTLAATALSDTLALPEVTLPEDSIFDEITIDPNADPGPIIHGKLAGRFWSNDPNTGSDHAGGLLRGQWLNHTGDPVGTIHGHYHPLPLGDLPGGLTGGGVFRGRYFDDQGELRGLLRGRYGHGPEGRALFFGRWYDQANHLVGVLRGTWTDDPNTPGGHFAGRWAGFNLCDELDSLPTYEFDPVDFGGFDAADEPVDELPAEPPPHGVIGPMDPPLIELPPCVDPNQPFGMLRGWYMPYPPPAQVDPNDPNAPVADGSFRGRWRTARGIVVGHLLGRYENLPPGEDEGDGVLLGKFYGKYVDLSGRFRGFIRGAYGRSAHGVGVFRGEYFNAAGDAQGVLLGHWRIAPQRPGGPYGGFWFGADLDGDS